MEKKLVSKETEKAESTTDLLMGIVKEEVDLVQLFTSVRHLQGRDMTNSDRMKLDICQQIMDMSEEDLREFLEMLSYYCSEEASALLDLSRCFFCDDCKRQFGGCDATDAIVLEECKRRFKDYCDSPVGR